MKQKPAYILDMRLPPGTFDVNVTPDKREIFMTGVSSDGFYKVLLSEVASCLVFSQMCLVRYKAYIGAGTDGDPRPGLRSGEFHPPTAVAAAGTLIYRVGFARARYTIPKKSDVCLRATV